ncbi:MAG TPA: EamA family transporter RarD [Rhodobacter sp.]|nr:EamA family transporter RarD [Rhodobacter sp.]
MALQQDRPENNDSRRGFAFAMSAYALWGIMPLYMKALANVPALEILVHRVIWSLPIAALVILITGRTKELMQAFRTPKTLAMAGLTAALISVNWGIYVWAIANDHALDAALGYYINPLFSVFLGAVLLGERLTRRQQLAISMAVLAVLILTYEAGRLPLLSLGLPLTFGTYAYLKKSLPVGPNQGFFLEILLLMPVALGYMARHDQRHLNKAQKRLQRRLCLTRHLPQTDRRGQCVKRHRDRSAPRQRPLGQMRKVAGGGNLIQ